MYLSFPCLQSWRKLFPWLHMQLIIVSMILQDIMLFITFKIQCTNWQIEFIWNIRITRNRMQTKHNCESLNVVTLWNSILTLCHRYYKNIAYVFRWFSRPKIVIQVIQKDVNSWSTFFFFWLSWVWSSKHVHCKYVIMSTVLTEIRWRSEKIRLEIIECF